MRISLIIATVDRTSEFQELIGAIMRQNYSDIEIIVVDQNDDDRLSDIILETKKILKVEWIRSSIRNNSHARNIGLSRATGDVIGFPDDDCIYPINFLSKVACAFEADPTLAFLTGPSLSYNGRLGSGRWNRGSSDITIENIWTSITEFNFFIRTFWVNHVDGFDDSFGLGARFGAAEGIDMALRIMKSDGRGYYNFDLTVIHPDKGYNEFTILRAYRYGTGLGQVLRRHKIPLRIVAKFFIRPIGGALMHLTRGNFSGVMFHIQSLRGRLSGFLN